MTKREIITVKFKDIYEQIEAELNYYKGADVSSEFLSNAFAYNITKKEFERLMEVAKPAMFFTEEDDIYQDYSRVDDLEEFEEEFFKVYRNDKKENNFQKDLLAYAVMQASTNKNEITHAILCAIKAHTYSPSNKRTIIVEQIKNIDISKLYELDIISFERTIEVVDNICDKKIELEKLNNNQLNALRKVLNEQEKEYEEKTQTVYGKATREYWNGEYQWERDVLYEPSKETVAKFSLKAEKTKNLIKKIDELLAKNKSTDEPELN